VLFETATCLILVMSCVCPISFKITVTVTAYVSWIIGVARNLSWGHLWGPKGCCKLPHRGSRRKIKKFGAVLKMYFRRRDKKFVTKDKRDSIRLLVPILDSWGAVAPQCPSPGNPSKQPNYTSVSVNTLQQAKCLSCTSKHRMVKIPAWVSTSTTRWH